MNKIIADFAQTLISEGYFDNLPENDRLFYKSSKLRKDNEWYEKCRVASELLGVEEQLDELVSCYKENTVLHALLKNKKNVCVSSIPNTKHSLIDYFFCLYLEKQHPHLNVELVKLVPIDEYHFFDFDKLYLNGTSHRDYPRTKKYIINVSESETEVGHVFVCDENGCWQ